MKLFNCFIVALLLVISIHVNAQRVRLNGALGLSAYYGDLIQGTPALQDVSPQMQLGATYDLKKQLRFRLGLAFMKVKAADRNNVRIDYRERNLSFSSNIFEFSPMIEYDFVSREEYFLVPYVYGGLGFFTYNPTTIDPNGQKVNLRDWSTEGQGIAGINLGKSYGKSGFSIPFGIGIRYELSEDLSIGAEFNVRRTFTDYIDDVSSNAYPDPVLLAAAKPGAERLSYRGYELGVGFPGVSRPRGNSRQKDIYYSLQFAITYRLANFRLGRDLDFYGGTGQSRKRVRNPRYVL